METKRKELDLDDELAQLLKEQEEFLNKNERPAAKLKRMGGGSQNKQSPQPPANEEKPVEEGPRILGQVVERDVIPLNSASLVKNLGIRAQKEIDGFPAMQRRGQSVFGRRQRLQTAPKLPMNSQPPIPASTAKPTPTIAMPKRAGLTQDRSEEEEEIHATNTARLQEMSVAEIREAQEELRRSLDPKLLEKLMNKNHKKQLPATSTEQDERPRNVNEKESYPSTKMETPSTIDLASIKSEEELHEKARLLPPEERAKHTWMENIPTQTRNKNDNNNATSNKKNLRRDQGIGLEPTLERFDFNGDRILTQDSLPVHSGLYHHGEDPDAAGYTMPELVHLARSTVASQRAMALTTIAKILLRRQQQLDQSQRYPQILPKELPMALRIALDDQNYTALSAAVSALHGFLVPVADPDLMVVGKIFHDFETKFGAILSPPCVNLHKNVAPSALLRVPETEEVIYIDTSESPEDGSSINDEELTVIDPVQGFLNMDIGTRFRYILDTIQLPDQDSAEKMLDILILIAKHSPKAAKDIGTNLKLMKTLQQKYVESEAVLTQEDDNGRALRLTVKALVLVRVLCQGERAVASVLMGNGMIQSTKGFLALKGYQSSALFARIQVECLRIWRVLLGYGLDFHCFGYLYPMLCGFHGVDLVQQQETEKKSAGAHNDDDTRTSALFAVLEAFCGLESLHEAQHYFNQLGFFMNQAKEEIVTRLSNQEGSTESIDDHTILIVSTAVRFLTAISRLVIKFHLERKILIDVFQFLQSSAITGKTISYVVATTSGRELISSILYFQQQIVINGLLSDDMDEEEVARQLFDRIKRHLQSSIALADEVASGLAWKQVAQTCDLIVLTAAMLAQLRDAVDDAFVGSIYKYALGVVNRLITGQEYWISQLLTQVLFHPVVLQKIGFFSNEVEATTMSHILIPIYNALVNCTREQEDHSMRNFANMKRSPIEKVSFHLQIPQHEQEYISSNLPLPSFWVFCPFSRMEYNSSSAQGDQRKQNTPPTGPTHAQSEEMKLIVSATCRFLYQLEATEWKNTAQMDMQEEDKLFHLIHVFFAGSDVLFDEHVDVALRQLMIKFVTPVLKSKKKTLLFDGMLHNLRRFQQLDPSSSASEGTSDLGSFSSDEQIVMNFVEKLVAEFTASSYGNIHFARCVTLFILNDFPVNIRKWVWKELQDCRLLHTLQPFDQDEERKVHITFVRSTQNVKVIDEQWLQLMKQAISQQQISLEHGSLAYSIAIHHLAVYLFGSRDQPQANLMSFGRQLLVKELVRDASSTSWNHILRYDSNTFQNFVSEGNDLLKNARIETILTQVELSTDEQDTLQKKVAIAH